MLREGAQTVFLQDIRGHAHLDGAHNVYGNSWRKERVDAATQALEGVTNTPQNAEKEKNQLESVSLAGLDVQRRNRLLSRMQVHADNLHLGLLGSELCRVNTAKFTRTVRRPTSFCHQKLSPAMSF